MCRNLKQAGAEVVLADRNQDVTLRRVFKVALLNEQRPEGLPIASELHRVLHAALYVKRNSRGSGSTLSALAIASPDFTQFDLQHTLGNCGLRQDHRRNLSGPRQMNWPTVWEEGTQALLF